MEEYIKEAENLLMHTYSRYKIVLDRGEGVYLYDTDGKKYLDFGAGIAVFALGYGNTEYNSALKAQIDKLLHTSNYFYNVPSIKAAARLAGASGMDRVFFTNSGTEAIEGAIKLARKYYYKKHHTGDSQIIAMNRSFHGRSMGALSVTGQPSYREAFEPLIGGVVFTDLNSIEDIKAKINEKTCAILLEPVQAEGGVYPADEEYLKELRRLCDEKDILLIFDEIQCGMGRTGSMFAWQEYGVKPDILTAAKALGCGVPVGAFAAVEKVCKAFEPGDHGTTYGGNPFTAAAVNAVFDQYEKLNLLHHVKEVSAYLEDRLDELAENHKEIKERRGKGLLQGLEFEYPVKDIILKAMDNNLILFSAGSNVLRFIPPLVITKEHVDEMIEILKKVI
ncbi:aspartate aminotransferase family protein [Anaerocolumna xylanovorans]|uniref:Acetylornithine aminotransferase n=1 Tax=Anaerocolumna xylanovorans DSM 12503 TaxID=1121345 RepID=A0A1M7YFC4_9FIRM|nr:aspartate aminotransferase family protein [Anaerocolumna xylanovorans]SHO51281.1 acetylornithine/N-succinyldiaminopimelate aminotransferase [Anaerocolumna xylanovorans DSM 12503]